MKQRNISIKWKIFLYLVGFCFLLLCILWLFQTVFLENAYKSIKLSEIKKDSASLAEYIRNGDWAGLREELSGRGDLYVEVWDSQSGTLLVAGALADGMPQSLSWREKQALLAQVEKDGAAVLQRYSDRYPAGAPMDRESILYAVPLQSAGEIRQLLLVSAFISPVNATVTTLRLQLVYISGIMLLLSVGLALLMSRRVSHPIEALNAAAKELGKGNYATPFCGDGYREIAELAGTLGEAAKELAKTEALRRDLIANVSHDLRTPLTLITGYGEMMRDLPGETTSENMQLIIDEAKRLSSLVDDLLDLSRLQSGAQPFLPEYFDLTAKTREIIGRFARLCEREGYIILFEQDENIVVNADPRRIEQVIYNFLINAVTHTGPDKTILVRQLVQNGNITIEVTDRGEGIAPEDLPQIWERYYRVDKVHKRAHTGSGLGLSIVKTILDSHPGVEYGVTSRLGAGSTFWFSLSRG